MLLTDWLANDDDALARALLLWPNVAPTDVLGELARDLPALAGGVEKP